MEILKLAKKISFEEIFKDYNLPSVLKSTTDPMTGESFEVVKDFYEWLEDFDIDCIDYTYRRRGDRNVFRNNSFADLFDFFNDELLAFYNEQVSAHKTKEMEKMVAKALEKVEKNQKNQDPVIVKINFDNNNDNGSNLN